MGSILLIVSFTEGQMCNPLPVVLPAVCPQGGSTPIQVFLKPFHLIIDIVHGEADIRVQDFEGLQGPFHFLEKIPEFFQQFLRLHVFLSTSFSIHKSPSYPRFWLLTAARITSVSMDFFSICSPRARASVIRLSTILGLPWEWLWRAERAAGSMIEAAPPAQAILWRIY